MGRVNAPVLGARAADPDAPAEDAPSKGPERTLDARERDQREAAEARAQSAVVILLLEIIAAKPAACQLAHAASLEGGDYSKHTSVKRRITGLNARSWGDSPGPGVYELAPTFERGEQV